MARTRRTSTAIAPKAKKKATTQIRNIPSIPRKIQDDSAPHPIAILVAEDYEEIPVLVSQDDCF
jgi:hypothetical protein